MSGKHDVLQKIRSIANYQFGKGVGEDLFPEDVEVAFSKRTKRIRYIYLDGKRLATLRPTNGMFSLTVAGARRILDGTKHLRLWVKVSRDATPFVGKGKSVFAKHVVEADKDIRPREEVIVLDEMDQLLAVGRAMLTGAEMKAFKRGVAVRVRWGVLEEVKNSR
jgi:uncharacterized protein with predicted RNA binding PUA domain